VKVVVQRRHGRERDLSVEPLGVLRDEMSGDGDEELRQVDGAQLVDRAQVVMHQPRHQSCSSGVMPSGYRTPRSQPGNSSRSCNDPTDMSRWQDRGVLTRESS
jgi:hypothetical protein